MKKFTKYSGNNDQQTPLVVILYEKKAIVYVFEVIRPNILKRFLPLIDLFFVNILILLVWFPTKL